jgi:uncharacterized protein (DUF58 family)
MRIRPGANAVRTLVALVLLSPITFVWPPMAFVLLAATAALVIAAIIDLRRVRPLLSHVAVRRTMPPLIGRAAPLEVQLAIHNGNVRSIHGEVRDQHPCSTTPRLVVFEIGVAPAGKATCTTVCRITERGLHQFGPVWVRLRGPWKLIDASRAFDCTGSVKVLPETFASREQLAKDAGAEQRLRDMIQRSRQQGAGTEFQSLDAYRAGDDPRRIDWRATARQQSFVVRRFQVERHRDVMIIVDAGRLMGSDAGRGSKLDCAVDAALNLARVALGSGDCCGAAAYDRAVRGFLPPLSGSTALKSIVECFYDLKVQWYESDFTPMLAELRARRAKRTFLIVISDVSDAETSGRLCAALRQLQHQHVVLFAALRTPLLSQVVAEPVETSADAARKVVALRLLRDRARALHALRRGGVHVLDVEPKELTLPLVNQFVELRQRNLL